LKQISGRNSGRNPTLAPLHYIQQHPEATACSEQCSMDHSSGAKAISLQATTMPAALAASSTSNHIAVSGTDVQGLDHIDPA